MYIIDFLHLTTFYVKQTVHVFIQISELFFT